MHFGITDTQWVGIGFALVGMLLVFLNTGSYAQQPKLAPEPADVPVSLAPPRPRVDPVYFYHLDLRRPFTRDEVLAAYRRRAMKLHPDQGGWADAFRKLVAEREKALRLAD